ncbi:MAG: YigZ family protein [Bacteroidales bacterium]|nr:YigZ family protein [Bacteroidales bacterium]
MESVANLVKDKYKSVAAPSEGLYKDKGSKFLAFIFPIETEEDVKDHLALIKKKYFDARHHCYAYRLGCNGEKWRANDDGEPSSTAGKPILGQIVSNDLSDVLIIVVRYFGGILLGTSGLIQAYKGASADAIANAQITEKIASKIYTIEFGYIQMNEVMKVIKDLKLNILTQNFDNTCTLEVKVRLSMENQFKELLKNTTIWQKA